MEQWVGTRPSSAGRHGGAKGGKGYAPPPTKRLSDTYAGTLMPAKPLVSFGVRYADGATLKHCVKRHIEAPAECKTWNFTKGVGPSAQPILMRHQAKDPGRFKPTWKHKRPKDAIPFDRERKADESRRQVRDALLEAKRSHQLMEQHNYNGFNIINGEIYDSSKIRSKPGGKRIVRKEEPPIEQQEAQIAAVQARRASRRDSLVAEGIAPGRRKSSVKDNFNPYF